MDTRDTPEQAELRRAARQLARELGPPSVADLDDQTRAKRLARAVRDAGWLELRHDSGDGAPWASGVEVAIVADALSTDGGAYNPLTKTYDLVKASDVFFGYGIEAHLETTVGYEFPLNFVLGLYKGAKDEYAPDPTVGLAIQFTGF